MERDHPGRGLVERASDNHNNNRVLEDKVVGKEVAVKRETNREREALAEKAEKGSAAKGTKPLASTAAKSGTKQPSAGVGLLIASRARPRNKELVIWLERKLAEFGT